MERTSLQISGDESLNALAKFSHDLDQITELPCLAERIITEFSGATHRPEGAVYLLLQSSQRFHCLARQGSADQDLFPLIITHDHPVVQQSPRLHQLLDTTPQTQPTSLAIQYRLQPSDLDGSATDMMIPLCCNNRLLAFILLRSPQKLLSPSSRQIDMLWVMAHMAAHSLNSLLLHNFQLQANTLLRYTNQFHTIAGMADSWAHAIRNPLTSIKTFIQLASERKDDPQFMSTFSQLALDDIRRVEHLTQGIFDSVRYRKPNPTDDDLNDIVSSCLYLLELTVRHRMIKIEKDLAPEPPRGMVDRQQLQLTLLNVLVNAVEALGPLGGTLRIRTGCLIQSHGTAWAHIDVEDTGQGIPVANQERIFDPFFSTKHQAGEPNRLGLGLTVAQHIIDAHRGTIHVQSTEGIGTTVSIHLPLCTV